MLNSWNGTKSTATLQSPSLGSTVPRSGVASKNGTTLSAQQQHMLQMRQVRSKLSTYHFAVTSTEILRKYAKFPASLLFHIYNTHYRFNNTQDSSIIPKQSPMAKSFLKHIIREEIPTEMTELLKDFSIRFYDGCVILQVYDHRNMGDDEKKEDTEPEVRKPKTYRTLLRPTPQSLYYDLLYHTDPTPTKFTDHLSLQMEAEILTLTHRKLDLLVPLNPYLQDKCIQPESEYPKKEWDAKADEWHMTHRHLPETSREPRRLHEDQLVMHKSSEYEELMFLLSNHYKNPADSTSEKMLVVVGPTNVALSDSVLLEATPSVGASASEKPKREKPAISTAAAVLSTGNATSNQFMRLRFIEEIRKRKETQKAQAGAAVAALTGSLTAPPGVDATSAMQKQPPKRIPTGQATTPQTTAAVPRQQMAPGRTTAPAQNFAGQRLKVRPGVPANVSPNVPGSAPANVQANASKQANFMRTQQYQLQQRQQQMRQGQMGQGQLNLGIQGQMSQMNQGQNIGQSMGQNMALTNLNQSMNLGPMTTQMGQTQMGQTLLNQNLQGSLAPAAKRQKIMNQQYAQPMRQMNGSLPAPAPGTPVMANGMTTPIMNNQIPPNTQQRQQMGQRPASVQAQNAPGLMTLQQQQQQIFQRTLTQQEQQVFRQLQARMNTLVQMGNTGIAPNRSQLTPQQQQQAIQQAKHIQQQLLQKFPTYFQRLRQFQILQQQRRQAAMQRQNPQQQSIPQNQNVDSSMFQQNVGMNMSLPMMQQQQMMGLPMMQQMPNMQQGQRKNVKREGG